MMGGWMKQLYTSLGIFLSWSLAASAPAPEGLDVSRIEESYRSSESNLPDALDLNLQIAQTKGVTLNLTKNAHIPRDVPVYLGRGGRIKKYSPMDNNNFAVYIDTHNQANMLVQNVGIKGGPSSRTYRGSFHMDGDDYVLEPREDQQKGRRRRSADGPDPPDYVVFKMGNPSSSVYDYDDSSLLNNTNSDSGDDGEDQDLGELPDGLHSDVPYQHYGVELLIMVDYAIYNQWFQRSQATTLADREREAIENIRYYFSHVANGMDLRYQSIYEPDFGIYIRLKSFFIATTPADSPWTERYPNKESGTPRDYTNVYRALDDLERWLQERELELPVYDHASVFSGNLLYDGYHNGKRRTINGLTNINGICSERKVSINRDQGHYATMQTAAHELGHSLGANHDGTQNTCTGRDQYIMASTPGEITDRNYRHALTFSPCSIKQFRKFLRTLIRDERNCLANAIEGSLRASLELPGQRYPIDTQCRHIHGPNSFYCGGEPYDKVMCRRMWCYSPEKSKCTGSSEMRAYEGTTCGHHKWCQGGDCVRSNEAPAATDTCLSGDFKGRFYDGRSCRDVISSQPWRCYPSEFKYETQCCKSCANIRDDTHTGCEFGDRKAYCSRIKPFDCYVPRAERECCAKCRSFRKSAIADPSCQYGDRASWCSTMPPSTCYRNRDTCCERCAVHSSASADCPWGDQASWCKVVSQTLCYTSHRQCCETCRPTGPKGCEYGDRDQSCRRSDCQESRYQHLCCKTCSNQAAPALPPTTTTVTTTTKTSTPAPTSKQTTTHTPTTPRPPVSKDCPSGDMGWCRHIRRGGCYLYDSLCCETCVPTGPPDCMYGDRYQFCTKPQGIDCSDTFYKIHCCETCAANRAVGEDREPPTVTCPVLQRIFYVEPQQSSAFITWTTPRAVDQYCGTNVRLEITEPRGMSSATRSRWFQEGRHRIMYRATDCNGNTNTCAIQINVAVKTCERPQRPAHGQITCTPQRDEHAFLGDSCSFSCQSGYRMDGDSVQLCLEGRRWSGGGTVTCLKLECGRPQQSADMVLDECTDGYKFGSACYFGCKPPLSRINQGKGWVTCTASGTWEGQVEPCRDREPPVIRNCPSDIFVYTDKGTQTAVVHWNPPSAWDRVDGSVDVIKREGREPYYSFPPGEHKVTYTAYDSSDNRARTCSFTITVQQISCEEIVDRENLVVSCPRGVIYGAVCSFRCLADSQLVGAPQAKCDKTRTDPPSGVWDWGQYKHQPYCEGCDGDEAEWCPDIPDQDCYVSDDICCATCRERERPGAPNDCKYGDKVSWCERHVHSARDCQSGNTAESCCRTCEQYLNPVLDNCVDDASWCATVESFHCYKDATIETCCDACRRRRTGPAGCEYGDKASWCPLLNAEHCRQQQDQCCYSCR